MFKLADRAPFTAALKTTEIEQDLPAATLAQLFVCVKSPGFKPVMVMALTIRAPLPVFDRVMT